MPLLLSLSLTLSLVLPLLLVSVFVFRLMFVLSLQLLLVLLFWLVSLFVFALSVCLFASRAEGIRQPAVVEADWLSHNLVFRLERKDSACMLKVCLPVTLATSGRS